MPKVTFKRCVIKASDRSLSKHVVASSSGLPSVSDRKKFANVQPLAIGDSIPSQTAHSMEIAFGVVASQYPNDTFQTATTNRGKEFAVYLVVGKSKAHVATFIEWKTRQYVVLKMPERSTTVL